MAATATKLVQEFVEAIETGALRPGDQLAPQRTYAYERGIAPSTASRVYGELLRRGLAVGEVGRGTFVADRASPMANLRTLDLPDARIDLEYNFPAAPGQSAELAAAIAAINQPERLDFAMRPLDAAALARARQIAGRGISSEAWQPEPDALVFTGNGRQSIAAALSAAVPVGGRLAIEQLTYPLVKGIAHRLGITLVPIPLDDEGLDIHALKRAHQSIGFSAIYLQPVLHNPLGFSMSQSRREALAELSNELDVYLVEDRVFSFLVEPINVPTPARERTIVVDSLSKRVAPGVGVGLIHAPRALHDRMAIAARTGAWSVTPYLLELGLHLWETGVVARLASAKRLDTAARQSIARTHLGEDIWQADPRASHGWLHLPERWRADAFVAAAARQSIAVSPSRSFAVASGHSPNAVRLALSSPAHEDLDGALKVLKALVEARPDDVDFTE
jgi:DNA-binding transcriptional MocR family regulator